MKGRNVKHYYFKLTKKCTKVFVLLVTVELVLNEIWSTVFKHFVRFALKDE